MAGIGVSRFRLGAFMSYFANRIDPHLRLNRPEEPETLDGAFRMDERLLTAQEVADRLGVSERWVRDHATRRNPRLRAIKLGPLLRFRWLDVQLLIEKLGTDKT